MAFATKGILPDFRDNKWDHEADKTGFPEWARGFMTILEARFSEAVILHGY